VNIFLIVLIFDRAFEKDIVSQVTQGGASNAIFFYSNGTGHKNGAFIVKSCSYAEMEQIKSKAESLRDHFQQHPDSLITKV
jgi:hypothetical protein